MRKLIYKRAKIIPEKGNIDLHELNGDLLLRAHFLLSCAESLCSRTDRHTHSPLAQASSAAHTRYACQLVGGSSCRSVTTHDWLLSLSCVFCRTAYIYIFKEPLLNKLQVYNRLTFCSNILRPHDGTSFIFCVKLVQS